MDEPDDGGQAGGFFDVEVEAGEAGGAEHGVQGSVVGFEAGGGAVEGAVGALGGAAEEAEDR